MITGVITVPITLNTFIVNVSLSNSGGDFLSTPLFKFGFLGPVTNINSAVKNCSTIGVSWTAPMVDDRVPIQYYILRTYDAITGSLVNNVSVYDTSYQFVNNNLLIHHYTYVIIGVNELGEGISHNETFSYERVPRSVSGTGSNLKTFNQMTATVSYNIPVTLGCIGEAPENATIIIWCNGAGVVYHSIEQVKYLYPVENAPKPMNITGSASVPKNQQCNMSIAFSNGAGSSEPFILVINISPTPSVSVTPSPTINTDIPELTVFIIAGIAVILVLVICIFIIFTVALSINSSLC
ncbi:PREDICTED: uncharacterized protein LOC109583433 [Amphimedon queenslandica]|nr:PREDICTED: uncharacterized protein LOC109583433 [Amphimedon queenslandica]|eukprot:XP_019854339.1 PREDICTED: uncharacterized protein LOC109583433 [Amphimedon queenslandica]